MTTTSLTQEVIDISYDQYIKENNNDYIKYMEHFVKPDTNLNEYPKSTYINQITWLSKSIKKPKDIFLARSIFDNYINNSNQSIVYELDATSSGIQLVGMLMKSKTLCTLSNVIGNKYTDIYSIFAKEFLQSIELGKEYINLLFSRLDLPNIDSILNEPEIRDISLVTNMIEAIKYLLYCDIETLPKVSKYIINTINIQVKEKKWEYLTIKYPTEIYWIFNRELREFIQSSLREHNQGTYFVKLMLNARVIYEYLSSLRANPWIDLTDRSLYKTPIMAFAYSMSSLGRIAHFKQYLQDYANARGINKIDIRSVDTLASIIDKYFLKFETQYLKDGAAFLTIVKYHINNSIENKQSIFITNNYHTWEFSCYKTIIAQIPLPNTARMSLFIKTSELDQKKAITSFASICIHSLDSDLVYLYHHIMINIRDKLNENKIYLNMGLFTNHDNYGINIALSPFLKIIIQECYNRLSELEYIKQLKCKGNSKIIDKLLKEAIINCINKNFIKH